MTQTPWQELETIRSQRLELLNQINIIAEREMVLIDQCRSFLYCDSPGNLTPTELKIFNLLQSDPGLRNKEIADKISATETTVKFHLGNMYVKLKVDGRRDMLRKFGSKRTV